MLVPPLSIAIFTNLFKKGGYKVYLFDTTSYVSSEISSSPQNRTLSDKPYKDTKNEVSDTNIKMTKDDLVLLTMNN